MVKEDSKPSPHPESELQEVPPPSYESSSQYTDVKVDEPPPSYVELVS